MKDVKYSLDRSVIDHTIEWLTDFSNKSPRGRAISVLKVTLLVIAAAGAITAVMAAPNVAAAAGKFRRQTKRKVSPYDVRRAIHALQQQHLVESLGKGTACRYRLTQFGRLKLKFFQLAKTDRRQYWDKKWRLVIFDIPTRNKAARDGLRKILRDIGFVEIQKSAYLYPYDVFDALGEYRQLYNLVSFVLFATVNNIERDRHFRQKFNLI